MVRRGGLGVGRVDVHGVGRDRLGLGLRCGDRLGLGDLRRLGVGDDLGLSLGDDLGLSDHLRLGFGDDLRRGNHLGLRDHPGLRDLLGLSLGDDLGLSDHLRLGLGDDLRRGNDLGLRDHLGLRGDHDGLGLGDDLGFRDHLRLRGDRDRLGGDDLGFRDDRRLRGEHDRLGLGDDLGLRDVLDFCRDVRLGDSVRLDDPFRLRGDQLRGDDRALSLGDDLGLGDQLDLCGDHLGLRDHLRLGYHLRHGSDWLGLGNDLRLDHGGGLGARRSRPTSPRRGDRLLAVSDDPRLSDIDRWFFGSRFGPGNDLGAEHGVGVDGDLGFGRDFSSRSGRDRGGMFAFIGVELRIEVLAWAEATSEETAAAGGLALGSRALRGLGRDGIDHDRSRCHVAKVDMSGFGGRFRGWFGAGRDGRRNLGSDHDTLRPSFLVDRRLRRDRLGCRRLGDRGLGRGLGSHRRSGCDRVFCDDGLRLRRDRLRRHVSRDRRLGGRLCGRRDLLDDRWLDSAGHRGQRLQPGGHIDLFQRIDRLEIERRLRLGQLETLGSAGGGMMTVRPVEAPRIGHERRRCDLRRPLERRLSERRRRELVPRRARQTARLGLVPAVRARVLPTGHAEREGLVEGVELMRGRLALGLAPRSGHRLIHRRVVGQDEVLEAARDGPDAREACSTAGGFERVARAAAFAE